VLQRKCNNRLSLHCCWAKKCFVQLLTRKVQILRMYLCSCPSMNNTQVVFFCAVFYFLQWPVRLYHIFPTLPHKRHDFRGRNFIKHTVCVCVRACVSSTSCAWTFPILRRIRRDINLRKSSFQDVNETWIFSIYFRKIDKHQISGKSGECEPSCFMRMYERTDGRTDGQTDRQTLQS